MRVFRVRLSGFLQRHDRFFHNVLVRQDDPVLGVDHEAGAQPLRERLTPPVRERRDLHLGRHGVDRDDARIGRFRDRREAERRRLHGDPRRDDGGRRREGRRRRRGARDGRCSRRERHAPLPTTARGSVRRLTPRHDERESCEPDDHV